MRNVRSKCNICGELLTRIDFDYDYSWRANPYHPEDRKRCKKCIEENFITNKIKNQEKETK